jgi:hypothetical protein
VDDTLNGYPRQFFNWISFHENGDALYPMFAVNRRGTSGGNLDMLEEKDLKQKTL